MGRGDGAYWDAFAAPATPPDLGWFPAAIAGQGRADLDRALRERRDCFLGEALEYLTQQPPRPQGPLPARRTA